MSDEDPAGGSDDAATVERGAPDDGGAAEGEAPSGGVVAAIRRFWHVEEGPLVFVRDLVSSALMVVVVAGLLFAVSGVWPPMVAVKSSSMNPHMHKGDLVFVTEEHRFAGDAAVAGTGVVPNHAASDVGYRKFGGHGDVIVYRPNNQTDRDPIIHRAMFYVEEGENWYDEADPQHVRSDACEVDDDPNTDTGLRNCPAPNAGFITKGDNPDSNKFYDQAQGMSRPVRPSWVEAKAMVRIPALGWIRLKWAQLQMTGGMVAGLLAVGGVAGSRLQAAS